jgi:hypothetical protein
MSKKRYKCSMKLKCRGAVAEFGRRGVIFEEEDVVRLLRVEVEKDGSQAAFARRGNVERLYVNAILCGKRPVTKTVANAIGLRRTYTTK